MNNDAVIRTLMPLLKSGPTNNLWTLLAVVDEWYPFASESEQMRTLFAVVAELLSKHSMKIYDCIGRRAEIENEDYLKYFELKYLQGHGCDVFLDHNYYFAV